jgi:hypothetical protein
MANGPTTSDERTPKELPQLPDLQPRQCSVSSIPAAEACHRHCKSSRIVHIMPIVVCADLKSVASACYQGCSQSMPQGSKREQEVDPLIFLKSMHI